MNGNDAVNLPIPYAHFLVSLEGGEEETRMNQFLQQHAVLKIDQKFVERGDGPMWAYAIRYEKGGPLKVPGMKPESKNGNTERIDYRDKLSPEDFSLYLDLKDWRKGRAEKEGTKVFAVFTNDQLAAIAEQKPVSDRFRPAS